MSDANEGYVVLPFPATPTSTRSVRSTVMLGAIGALRQGGHFDRYVAALDPRHHDTLLRAVAGTWIPFDVAKDHYRACDSLGLSPDAVVALGQFTFEKTAGTMFGTILRLAKVAGATPWTVLPAMQRFWDRSYDGGGVQVVRLGRKEAQIDVVQCPLAASSYFRNAVRGGLQTVLRMYCEQLHVQEVAGAARVASSLALRCRWA